MARAQRLRRRRTRPAGTGEVLEIDRESPLGSVGKGARDALDRTVVVDVVEATDVGRNRDRGMTIALIVFS